MKTSLDKNWKNILMVIFRDLFLASFFLFAVFTLMEIIKPKIILNYLNLDIYFFAMLILGALTVMYFAPEQGEIKKLNFLEHTAIILFSVVVGILVSYLTRTLGWLGILVGLACAVICYFFINPTRYE
ncbi:MAG: hypothetical protein WC460_00845 [Patescibacteria group bacterium]